MGKRRPTIPKFSTLKHAFGKLSIISNLLDTNPQAVPMTIRNHQSFIQTQGLIVPSQPPLRRK